ILRDFGKHTRQEDPVVHFYETFLAAYDPKMREARGVYYTPEPVVSYIVRSVDHLLKNDFGLPDGLADATKLKATGPDGACSLETHKVQILDPATGTGTFLHNVIDHIHETFKGNKGMWSAYVSQHLLPRLFGFELLMAPYAVAHMKLGLQLAETGYDFKSNERLGVYLTNTLEEGFDGGKLPFAEWIVEEANSASNVKYDAPVMVVIGNPPYSNFGMMNKGKWILELLKDYKRDLHEKKLNLDDDFIKFIRFAQWRIEQTGYGILAFITNNTYIDGITHRRMRQSLMNIFTDIYILDLHGSSMKKEKSPDGSKDENVFDIQQGVAISIFVKQSHGKQDMVNVRHAHLYGMRQSKYEWLSDRSIETTEWEKVTLREPQFFFVPHARINVEEYETGWQVTQIFPNVSSGFQTKRDSFTIHENMHNLNKVLKDLLTSSEEDIRLKYDLPPDGRDWTIMWAKNHIRQLNNLGRLLPTACLYRPFDIRYTIFDDKFKGFLAYPRYDVLSHMLQPNIALITTRQLSGNDFRHVFATRQVIDGNTISLQTREYNYIFPLYLYPQLEKNALFNTDKSDDAPDGRRPNLSLVFISAMEDKLNMRFVPDGKGNLHETFGPEDVFHYMYAVFHSPTYRTRYAEFLKIDFPRLPLTSKPDLFHILCKLGERLVALHLMEQYATDLPSYPIEGNNIVEKVDYLIPPDQPGRIYINKTQYFDNVPQNVWEFHVGGYQVCHKWLKDRKGRTLLYEDIRHYQRTVAALAETIEVMEKIDEAIEEHGSWPVE
ncbi:MAG: type ISP restriction/modification enzyme, partial [Ktedonobacteraceae bacterium]